MSSRLRSLYFFLKESGLSSEAFSLRKIIKISQTTVDMEGAEVKLDGFNPFNIKGEEEVIRVKGAKQFHGPSSLSVKTNPVVMPDKTTVYTINNKYDIHGNLTMIHDGATEYSGDNVFGESSYDIHKNIKFDFNQEEFKKEIQSIQRNLNAASKLRKEEGGFSSLVAELESFTRSSGRVKVFSSSELSNNFSEDYLKYLSAPDVLLLYNRDGNVAADILDSFEVDIRTDKQKIGAMWWDRDSDIVYYSEDLGLHDPVSQMYRLDKREHDSRGFLNEVLDDPENGYSRILELKNAGMDSYIVPAIYISLGCNMFAFGNVLSSDGELIVFEDSSLPEEGASVYSGRGVNNYKPTYAYTFKKDKVTNPKYIEKLEKVDGCIVKELREAQYSNLEKRVGDIPEYTPPAREIEDDTPNPLSFSDYKKKTEDSNYWGLPDPEYPEIEPGDSWENICKIYPNHPKCKNNKSNFSYNPSDEFEFGNREYKSPFGGGYITEESIMNSDIAKEYVEKVLGGISNIKNTTSIGGVKMYYLPDENVMSKAVSLGGSKL